MSGEYLAERLGAVLNTALWSVRLGSEAQAQKSFAMALDLVRTEGGFHDEIIPILDEYAASFRSAGRAAEADQLAALAKKLREDFPDLYYPDGSEIPWFKQEKFTRTIPKFPIELKPSHAEPLSGCGCGIGMTVTFFAGLLLLSIPAVLLPGPLPQPLGDIVLFGYLGVVLLGGIVNHLRRSSELRRNNDESWCRITEGGIEFKAPDEVFNFKWHEITKLETTFDSGVGDDETHSVVLVYSGARHFRMSARFYTEEEVKLVEGIVRLKAGKPI